jgi:RHS repeat-associated protein
MPSPFEYNANNIVKRVATSEGQLVPSGDTLRFDYFLKDHLGNVRVVFNEKGDIIQKSDYYPFGLEIDRNSPVQAQNARNGVNRYLYNGKELQVGSGYIDYGARMYMPEIGRWGVVDSKSEFSNSMSPYNYTSNNPINRFDPDGNLDYPIITITKQKTGQTADQRVIGYSGGKTTKADLYKAVVTDTEDKSFKMEFLTTRDAWVDTDGSGVATNVAFEPKDGNINHYTGKVMGNGYPAGNGTEALKLSQNGSEVVHAQGNQASVDMGYRKKTDVASGVMIHVGGNYQKDGKNKVAASEGCFGACNPGNSSTNQSNSYSNTVMNAIQNQANKSKTNPGKIEIIIQKRSGNEFPTTKKY